MLNKDDVVLERQYHWISHELRCDTPVYGGGEGLTILHEKQIASGSNCNSSKLTFSNHLGTHVDVPYHFIQSGKKVSDYQAEQWLFHKTLLVTLEISPDEIIRLSMLQDVLDVESDIELLLIKTGFEQYRQSETYWQHS